jgi:SAM-dependent methyltransferase
MISLDVAGRTTGAAEWDREYVDRQMPSTNRLVPSKAIGWALDNWPHLSPVPRPGRALDLGCGTGRNSCALAQHGIDVVGVDFAANGLRIARHARREAAVAGRLDLVRADLRESFPFAVASFDFVADIFVYFHQLDPAGRRAYRRNVHRLLRDDGILLCSLATSGDGYYSSCTTAGTDAEGVRITYDPVPGIANVLFAESQFLGEMADRFELLVLWRKRNISEMYGRQLHREVLVTLWRKRPAIPPWQAG